MPLTYREAVQIALLLACVPLQYMLSMNMEIEQSSSITRKIAVDFQYFRDNWLSTEAWAKSAFESVQFLIRGEQTLAHYDKSSCYADACYMPLSSTCVSFWCLFLLLGVLPDPNPNMFYGTVGENESPAYEVLRYRQERGFFTSSLSVRWKRPSHVQFRVGQVVKHRSEGYTGVIVGWDVKARVGSLFFFLNHQIFLLAFILIFKHVQTVLSSMERLQKAGCFGNTEIFKLVEFHVFYYKMP